MQASPSPASHAPNVSIIIIIKVHCALCDESMRRTKVKIIASIARSVISRW